MKENKILKIILIIFLLMMLLASLVYAGILIFQSTKKFLAKQLPDIASLASRLILPDPLVGPEKSSKAIQLEAEKIIQWTNQYRKEANLKLLSKNEQLSVAAYDKILDEFAKQYFAHVSPVNGRDISYFVSQAGYQYTLVGENLALGDFIDEKELVDAWMASPGHRENILNAQYADIGVASKYGKIIDRETWLIVQIFAKPAPNCTLPDQNLKTEIENKSKQYQQTSGLNQQIDSLIKTAKELMDEGNDKIKQGNKIYQQTKDQAAAQPYWDEGEKIYNQGKAKIDEANHLQDQVNNLITSYDQIKSLIEKYNSQIKGYNLCLGQ